MTIESLESLFDYLDAEIGSRCDGTHRLTREWAVQHSLDDLETEALLALLAKHGGCCCDCEVLLNVEPQLGAGHEPGTQQPLN